MRLWSGAWEYGWFGNDNVNTISLAEYRGFLSLNNLGQLGGNLLELLK